MLATGDVDVMMMPLNFVDLHGYNFEGLVLPEARKQNIGVMAMTIDRFVHRSQRVRAFSLVGLAAKVRLARAKRRH